MLKVARSFKFQGTEKQLFSQGTEGSINLKYESLTAVDYNYKEIPALLSVMGERR